MTMHETYKLSAERYISGEPGVAGSSSEQILSGVSPAELARAAQKLARETGDNVIISAEHWPRKSVGMRDRLSTVFVSSTTDLELVVEQISERNDGEAGWD